MEYVRSYTTIDKTAWGPGPWQVEPDKLQWVDPATQMDCLAVRHDDSGHWCGYVGVPETHPLFGIGYSEPVGPCNCEDRDDPDHYCWTMSPDCFLNVHGGITFASFCQDGPEDSVVCHVPFDGRPDTVWWFGWDCAHAYDFAPGRTARYRSLGFGDVYEKDDVYRDLPYVMEQCAHLAKQLVG